MTNPQVPPDQGEPTFNIEQAKIVSYIPTKVWIESGMGGERYVMRQYEGYPAFEYARFGYDYSHTSNSGTMADATRLALALGATEPIEHKSRGFESLGKWVKKEDYDALQAKLDEANLLALSLQGQIVEMMAQPTEAWLIEYQIPSRIGKSKYAHTHNPISDYRKIDPNATVTELIPRVSPL